MDIEKSPAQLAGERAIEKLVEEHRKSGEPMVISPRSGIIQWVIPQDDGSMKVVSERKIEKKE